MGRKQTLTFPGGVHPTDGSDKELTANAAIRPYWPHTVTILSEQTPGAACRFLVKPGDRVKEGQLIGEPAAFTAAPLHASVTGSVLSIKEVENLGRRGLACILRREEPHTEPDAPYLREPADLNGISREEIIRGIRDGGLTGMGGAGFPTFRKYEGDRPAETLLINGAECEPYLTCDYRLMLEESLPLINGVRLLKKAAGARKAYICLEDNKLPAARRLQNVIEQTAASGIPDAEGHLEVKVFPTRYPQGGERQLIQTALSLEVPMGGLPLDVGVVVSNAATARAAADIVLGGIPLTRRVVTVTGQVERPGNYLVPIGTSAENLLRLSGGLKAQNCRIIAGGPMTGSCAASRRDGKDGLFYVTKSTSGILALPDTAYEEQPCIRCLGCERVCPAGLVPYQIDFACLEKDFDLCERLYASECIACGCCSYICPARRELTLRTRLARDTVKQRQRERKAENT